MQASRRTRTLPRWEQPEARAAARAAVLAPGQVIALTGLELVTRAAPAAPTGAGYLADGRRIALLEARAALAAAVHESETAAGALRATVRELCAALGWPVGRAVLLAGPAAPVWHGAASGRYDAFREAVDALDPAAGHGAAGRALAAGRPVWIADLRADGTPAASRASHDAGLRAAVAFPVPAAGAVGAVVELYAAGAEGCDRAVLETCAFAARQLCVALERIAERDARRGDADLLRAVIEGSPAATVCLDAEGALALWSPAAEQALGFGAAEAAERLRASADAGWRELADAAGRAQRTGLATATMLRWRRADGGERRVEVHCTPLLAPGGEVRGVAAHLIDRTAEGAAAEAEARGRDRDQVLAVVSHDLRSPLHLISIASGALLRAWSGDPARAAEAGQMASIAQAADRMRRLVNDLLDAARTDAGALSVCPEPMPASVLLRRAVEAHRPLAEQKGVALTLSDVSPSLVMADEQRVYQVFSNLIGNALRFTPAGGAVTLGARPDGDSVRLTVTDTGCGIAADDLPKVFERFWRGARCGGTGLGLSITRTLVEAHGGRVWADSRPGEGSTFSFTLPLSGPACASV